jgi:hypothetical protein
MNPKISTPNQANVLNVSNHISCQINNFSPNLRVSASLRETSSLLSASPRLCVRP